MIWRALCRMLWKVNWKECVRKVPINMISSKGQAQKISAGYNIWSDPSSIHILRVSGQTSFPILLCIRLRGCHLGINSSNSIPPNQNTFPLPLSHQRDVHLSFRQTCPPSIAAVSSRSVRGYMIFSSHFFFRITNKFSPKQKIPNYIHSSISLGIQADRHDSPFAGDWYAPLADDWWKNNGSALLAARRDILYKLTPKYQGD